MAQNNLVVRGVSVRTLVIIVSISAIILCLMVLLPHTGLYPVDAEPHDQQTIVFSDCEDETLATLDVNISETPNQKYIGLSDRESIGYSEGMLFTYSSEDERKFVMRNMKFSIDIIYVDDNGRIQSIKTAENPSNSIEYYLTYDSVEGYGKYIIESNAGWTHSNGISEDDCVKELMN